MREVGTGVTEVDIVLTVHDGLRHVRSCLRSIELFTAEPHRLIVVDDASDPFVSTTVRYLVDRGWPGGNSRYLRNEENIGYLRSVNRGIDAGGGELVVTLNSDTLVTPGWLGGLQRCLAHADDVGFASPLSNHANQTRIAFPYGYTFLDLAAVVRRASPLRYPEIGIASGYCFIARRDLYDELGAFDEIYGRGYYEESDLCMRAAEAGYRTVADDATFVFHHGWGTFGVDARNELMERNREIFESRWGKTHDALQERLRAQKPFEDIERAIAADLAAAGGGDAPVESGPRWVAERFREETAVPATLRRSRTLSLHPVVDWCALVDRRSSRHPSDARRGERTVPRIVFLVPEVTRDPGSVALLQLVNRLLLDGFDAQVATYESVDPAAFSDPTYFRPHVLRDRDSLRERFPHPDLVIAASPELIYDALLLEMGTGCAVASFLQDEPDTGPYVWGEVLALDLVRHHIVRSRRVAEQLTGGTTHVVPVGVDLDVFWPSLEPRGTGGRIVVPVPRPLTDEDRRTLFEVLGSLIGSGARDVVTYGYDPHLGVEVADHAGLLSDEDRADLLREAALFVDVRSRPDDGRSRLEALATGTPVVVTAWRGWDDVCRGGRNSYAMEVGEEDRVVAGLVSQLLDDPSLPSDRVRAGYQTALAYDRRSEVRRFEEAVLDILR